MAKANNNPSKADLEAFRVAQATALGLDPKTATFAEINEATDKVVAKAKRNGGGTMWDLGIKPSGQLTFKRTGIALWRDDFETLIDLVAELAEADGEGFEIVVSEAVEAFIKEHDAELKTRDEGAAARTAMLAEKAEAKAAAEASATAEPPKRRRRAAS